VRQLSKGKLDLNEFAVEVLSSLRDAHVIAGYVGRNFAGDEEKEVKPSDYLHGESQIEEQMTYFYDFVTDISTGRYGPPDDLREQSILSRLHLYSARLYGSANEAWAERLTSDADPIVFWRLGPNENHCKDCPELAAGSPYRLSELPTLPGMGATQCSTNCRCYLENANGVMSPRSTYRNKQEEEVA